MLAVNKAACTRALSAIYMPRSDEAAGFLYTRLSGVPMLIASWMSNQEAVADYCTGVVVALASVTQARKARHGIFLLTKLGRYVGTRCTSYAKR